MTKIKMTIPNLTITMMTTMNIITTTPTIKATQMTKILILMIKKKQRNVMRATTKIKTKMKMLLTRAIMFSAHPV